MVTGTVARGPARCNCLVYVFQTGPMGFQTRVLDLSESYILIDFQVFTVLFGIYMNENKHVPMATQHCNMLMVSYIYVLYCHEKAPALGVG